MKNLLILILFVLFFVTSASAEEFSFWPEQGKQQKIIMKKLDGMTVNETCIKEKKICLKLIEKIKKNKVVRKNQEGPLGNPASINCEANNGQSEILRDQKNNEYDFCLLEKKYLIDSWDLIKK